MSTRYNNGSHYENHQRAAELHDNAAHAYRAAEQTHGEQDHLAGHERSRQALEHSQDAHQHTRGASAGHGVLAFGHDDIAALAHELWEARGCPDGSSEEDWFRAAEQLRSRALTPIEPIDPGRGNTGNHRAKDPTKEFKVERSKRTRGKEKP